MSKNGRDSYRPVRGPPLDIGEEGGGGGWSFCLAIFLYLFHKGNEIEKLYFFI